MDCEGKGAGQAHCANQTNHMGAINLAPTLT